jgi:hypothetical protein
MRSVMQKNKLILVLFTSVLTISIFLASISSTVFAAKPWNCTASCNVQAIEGKAPATFPERVTGIGTGSTETAACELAKKDATQKAVAGTYPRHCQCKCGQ